MSLFDQLGRIVANPGAQAVSGTAYEAASQENYPAYLERLNQSKAEVGQQLNELFAKLGEAFYDSHADDRQTPYEAQMTVIRDALADIARCEKQAEEIANRRRCPACGAELVEGSMFCNFCGTKLMQPQPAAESAAPQGQKICPKCNTLLQPDDIFCTTCGADLRK